VSEFAVGEMIVPASSRQNNSWADGNQNKFTKHHRGQGEQRACGIGRVRGMWKPYGN